MGREVGLPFPRLTTEEVTAVKIATVETVVPMLSVVKNR